MGIISRLRLLSRGSRPDLHDKYYELNLAAIASIYATYSDPSDIPLLMRDALTKVSDSQRSSPWSAIPSAQRLSRLLDQEQQASERHHRASSARCFRALLDNPKKRIRVISKSIDPARLPPLLFRCSP